MATSKRLANLLAIQIDARGNTAYLKGETVAVDLSRQVLEQLYGLLKEKYPVYPNDIDYALRVLKENHNADLKKNLPGYRFHHRPKTRYNPPGTRVRRPTLMPSATTTSSSASVRPERGRPIWPWPWPSPH